jgi:hypothetical protein
MAQPARNRDRIEKIYCPVVQTSVPAQWDNTSAPDNPVRGVTNLVGVTNLKLGLVTRKLL